MSRAADRHEEFENYWHPAFEDRNRHSGRSVRYRLAPNGMTLVPEGDALLPDGRLRYGDGGFVVPERLGARAMGLIRRGARFHRTMESVPDNPFATAGRVIVTLPDGHTISRRYSRKTRYIDGALSALLRAAEKRMARDEKHGVWAGSGAS
jgi:hypothetical protein